MLSVILQTADVPVVCPHGLYAARIVALSNKVHLVLSNLTQVFATVIHHLCDCLESRTSPNSIRPCLCGSFLPHLHNAPDT